MGKIILKKSYARDFSLAVEQLWIGEFKKNIGDMYGFKNPHEPYAVLYVTDENLEIWEHDKAISYFQDWLLQKNQESPAFMEEVIREYTRIVAKLEKYWERGGVADVAV